MTNASQPGFINKTWQSGTYTFSYREYGDRSLPVIILLHGFPQTLDTWHQTATLLSSNYRVLVPSQRGYGDRTVPSKTRDYRLETLAQDIRCLIDEAAGGVAHVVGHDWGGAVAWTVAREWPDKTQSLTVVSMPEIRSIFRNFNLRQAFKSWYVPLMTMTPAVDFLIRFHNGDTARKLLTRTGLPKEWADRYVSTLRGRSRTYWAPFRWYRATVYNSKQIASVDRIKSKTLLIYAHGDSAVDESVLLGSLQWVSGLSSVLSIDGSHWLPETRPEVLAGAVARHVSDTFEFLNRVA